jgi:hypothetical protein
MIKVFIPKHNIKDLRYLPILYPNFGALFSKNKLFADSAYRAIKAPVVEVVVEMNMADFLLLPFEYFDATRRYPEYFAECLTLARENGKKLLIFDLSDYTEEEISVSNAYVFRIAEYASRSQKNIIVMPTFVEDLGRGLISPREKGPVPIIGFCGWAGFKNFRQKIKFIIKNAILDLRGVFSGNKNIAVHKRGIYFRIKALAALSRSFLVKTNFIIRRSYSSHINTVEKSPAELRQEYIDNFMSSDLALCARGDANASCRFYEALSMGRVPFFVNTDCVLPLADEIDYDKFVVFADYRDIPKLGKIAAEFYNKISTADFIVMQKKAREVFVKYLNVEAFLNHILPKLAGREHK